MRKARRQVPPVSLPPRSTLQEIASPAQLHQEARQRAIAAKAERDLDWARMVNRTRRPAEVAPTDKKEAAAP